MQRFLRLRCEIGELMEDLDEMTESTRASSKSEGLSIQVKTLQTMHLLQVTGQQLKRTQATKLHVHVQRLL